MAFYENKTPNIMDLFREKCLKRILELNQNSNKLEEKLSQININHNSESDINNGQQSTESVSNEWQQMVSNDEEEYPFIQQELEQFAQKVKQEWVEEKDKYWEGLQTKEDMRRSAHFQYMLNNRKVLICPHCRESQMKLDSNYLWCECGIRCKTQLSINEIIGRIEEIIESHHKSCKDLFPQFHLFKSNLIVFCNTCPLNQFVL